MQKKTLFASDGPFVDIMYRSIKPFGLIFLLIITLSTSLHAQDLTSLNQTRIQTNRVGLSVLGVWAIGNMAFSGIRSTQLTGEPGYFHQMNFLWNTVNISLAGLGLYEAWNADPSAFDLYATIQEQGRIEKLLLLNTGLDVAYVAAGFYLIERAKRSAERSSMFSGYGKSLILQGGFLFAFDLGFYLAHHIRSENLKNMLQHIQPSSQGIGLSILF